MGLSSMFGRSDRVESQGVGIMETDTRGGLPLLVTAGKGMSIILFQ